MVLHVVDHVVHIGACYLWRWYCAHRNYIKFICFFNSLFSYIVRSRWNRPFVFLHYIFCTWKLLCFFVFCNIFMSCGVSIWYVVWDHVDNGYFKISRFWWFWRYCDIDDVMKSWYLVILTCWDPEISWFRGVRIWWYRGIWCIVSRYLKYVFVHILMHTYLRGYGR